MGASFSASSAATTRCATSPSPVSTSTAAAQASAPATWGAEYQTQHGVRGSGTSPSPRWTRSQSPASASPEGRSQPQATRMRRRKPSAAEVHSALCMGSSCAPAESQARKERPTSLDASARALCSSQAEMMCSGSSSPGQARRCVSASSWLRPAAPQRQPHGPKPPGGTCCPLVRELALGAPPSTTSRNWFRHACRASRSCCCVTVGRRRGVGV